MPRPIHTIGHSNHEAEAFAELLVRHRIEAVVDVRSSPFSRFAPQFNRDPLAADLRGRGIHYLFLGRELGARREERECYVEGQARYALIAGTRLFREGIERVRSGAESRSIALMCAEKDPVTCHRMILVGRALRRAGAELAHVLEDGSVESNADAEDRLLDLLDLPRGDLFRSREELVEEAYERQGSRIAWSGPGEPGSVEGAGAFP